MKVIKIISLSYLMLLPICCFGQGRITRSNLKNSSTQKTNIDYKSYNRKLISQAKKYYQNGDYEMAWDKLLDVYDSPNDTTYLMLLGDIGYIYKPNYANGGRWCYEKAAKLGCKLGEIKAHSFFRSRIIATGSGTKTPGDSLNHLGFKAKGADRINYFKAGANLGSSTAMVNLGRSYERGQDIELNFEKAAQLYQQAYNLNKSPDAASHLAWLYSLGLGVPIDLNKSFELYSMTGSFGGRDGVNLAICYDYGIGTNRNSIIALENYTNILSNSTDYEDWLEFASKRYLFLTQSEGIEISNDKITGHIGNIYYNLYCYINRRIINNDNTSKSEKNRYKIIAEQYLKDAIDVGVSSGSALNSIGNILKERKQYKDAIAWYHKAADKNESAAFWNLGYCYENGLGVSRDLHTAKEWYQKAEAAGNSGANEALKRLAKKGV